jgi:hypothetical protein
VSQIYEQALGRQVTDRADFLRRACEGDESLRVEVESLLAHASAPLSILDVPLAAWAAGSLQDSEESLIGRSVGGYQILSTLGAGGMGEVYRARDTRLDRTVAVKILAELGIYVGVALSPDEKRLVVERANLETGTSDLWMLELSTGILSPPDVSRIRRRAVVTGQPGACV